MPNTIIIAVSFIFAFLVVVFSLKSLIDTRKKYYDDYKERKEKMND